MKNGHLNFLLSSDWLSRQIRSLEHTRAKSGVALLLTFVAGNVDIIGALTVYHVFTAHMTGTTVNLGQQILERNWHAAVIGISVLCAFLIGSVLGRVLVEAGARASVRHIAALALLLELLLLAGIVPVGTAFLYPSSLQSASWLLHGKLLVVLAVAMGIQTAILTRIGPLTVHTTFVTGMLNKLAQVLSHCLFFTYDLRRLPEGKMRIAKLKGRREALQKARFLFGIWLVYVVGALCGTGLSHRLGLRALYVPCAGLLLALLIDLLRPLSLEEEQDESAP